MSEKGTFRIIDHLEDQNCMSFEYPDGKFVTVWEDGSVVITFPSGKSLVVTADNTISVPTEA